MPEASPFWQNAFLAWLFFCLAGSIWFGWRAGVVRGAVALGGLVAGYLAGVTAAASAPVVLGRFVPLPAELFGIAFGVVIGSAVFFGIWILGGILFTKTAHQRSLIVRMVYGLGGAALGVLFGLVAIGGSLFAVRAWGGFLEPRFDGAGGEVSDQRPVQLGLVKLKRSIEAGRTGSFFKGIDLVPEDAYTLIEKAGRVAAEPVAMQRFLEHPDIARVVTDSRFVALTSDPDVNDAAREKRVAELITNENVVAAAGDPGLVSKIAAVNLEAALDFALDASGLPVPESTDD